MERNLKHDAEKWIPVSETIMLDLSAAERGGNERDAALLS
jgi:hypothetical protein